MTTTDCDAKELDLRLRVTLQKFQCHMPARWSAEETETPLEAVVAVGLLGESARFEQHPVILRHGEAAELQLQHETQRLIPPEANHSFLELLSALVNTPVKITLSDDSGKEVAVGHLSLDGLVDEQTASISADVPLYTIDNVADFSECVANVDTSFAILQTIASACPESAGGATIEDLELLSSKCLNDLVVVKVAMEGIHPAPSEFVAAAQTAPALQLTTSVALHLSSADSSPLENPPIEIPAGVLTESTVQWEQERKCVCRLEDFKMLVESEAMLPLECWRVLSPEGQKTHFDPAFGFYHGIALIDPSQLLQPGTTSLKVSDMGFVASAVAFVKEHPAFKTAAQIPKAQPSPKLKAIEATPKGDASVSAWEAAESKIALNLEISRPLIPPWSPPPKLSATLEDLIPLQQLEHIHPNNGAAEVEFRRNVKEIAKSLVESRKKETQTDDSEAATKLELADTAEGLQEKLRTAIDAVIKQNYSPHGLIDLEGRLNELYMSLSRLAREALLEENFEESEPETEQHPERLLALAQQYEQSGESEEAKRRHLDRIAATPTAQSWVDYGCFCLRRSDWENAEQSLKQALSLDRESTTAMLALVCCWVRDGQATDSAQLSEAEVIKHSLLDSQPENPLHWALSTIVYTLMAEEEKRRNCKWKADTLFKECASSKDPFLELTELFIEYQALAAADLSLQMIKQESLESNACLLAKLSLLKGDRTEAKAVLDAHSQRLAKTEACLDVSLLRANILCKLGQQEEARYLFAHLLEQCPDNCPASVFIDYGRLLSMSDATNHTSHAENVYLHGCTQFPENVCLWTNLGAAYLSQAEYQKSQQALSKATILDPSNPNAWALLALLLLRTNRFEPAGHALDRAIAEGIYQVSIVEELLQELVQMGLFTRAQKLASLIA